MAIVKMSGSEKAKFSYVKNTFPCPSGILMIFPFWQNYKDDKAEQVVAAARQRKGSLSFGVSVVDCDLSMKQ